MNYNLLFNGDNLDILRTLRKKKFKADVVCIDPPYNDNNAFANNYVNKFSKDLGADRFAWSGSHSAFLDFMYPRLEECQLALTEDGVFFLMIGDYEYANLRIILNGIFGEKNYIGTIIWNKISGFSAKHMRKQHEYILVYAKDKKSLPRLVEDNKAYNDIIEITKSLKARGVPHSKAQEYFKKIVRDKFKGGEISEGLSLIHI